MNNDLKTLDVPPKDWYALTMNRQDWYELYTGRCLGVMDTQHLSVQCTTGDFSCECGRSFHQQGNLTHHLNYCNGQPRVVRKHFVCSCAQTFKQENHLTWHLKYCK